MRRSTTRYLSFDTLSSYTDNRKHTPYPYNPVACSNTCPPHTHTHAQLDRHVRLLEQHSSSLDAQHACWLWNLDVRFALSQSIAYH